MTPLPQNCAAQYVNVEVEEPCIIVTAGDVGGGGGAIYIECSRTATLMRLYLNEDLCEVRKHIIWLSGGKILGKANSKCQVSDVEECLVCFGDSKDPV